MVELRPEIDTSSSPGGTSCHTPPRRTSAASSESGTGEPSFSPKKPVRTPSEYSSSSPCTTQPFPLHTRRSDGWPCGRPRFGKHSTTKCAAVTPADASVTSGRRTWPRKHTAAPSSLLNEAAASRATDSTVSSAFTVTSTLSPSGERRTRREKGIGVAAGEALARCSGASSLAEQRCFTSGPARHPYKRVRVAFITVQLQYLCFGKALYSRRRQQAAPIRASRSAAG